MYWLLLYDLVDDYLERRRPLRERHLALARLSQGRGQLLMAGAFADPVDGAALVFRAGDVSVIEAFVAADPYVREGLVRSWAIRPWTVVIGAVGTEPARASSVDTPSVEAPSVAKPARRRDAPLRAPREGLEL